MAGRVDHIESQASHIKTGAVQKSDVRIELWSRGMPDGRHIEILGKWVGHRGVVDMSVCDQDRLEVPTSDHVKNGSGVPGIDRAGIDDHDRTLPIVKYPRVCSWACEGARVVGEYAIDLHLDSAGRHPIL